MYEDLDNFISYGMDYSKGNANRQTESKHRVSKKDLKIPDCKPTKIHDYQRFVK